MDVETRRVQRREAQRRYRERHPDLVRERSRAWRQANAEYVSQRYRRWRKENPEKAKAAEQRWRREHPDRVRFLRTDWERRNKQRVLDARRRRYELHRVELRAKVNRERAARKAELVAMLGGICRDCGQVPHVDAFEFDHVGQKTNRISNLLARASLWSQAVAEAQRCELVCANCHRVRTEARRRR